MLKRQRPSAPTSAPAFLRRLLLYPAELRARDCLFGDDFYRNNSSDGGLGRVRRYTRTPINSTSTETITHLANIISIELVSSAWTARASSSG